MCQNHHQAMENKLIFKNCSSKNGWGKPRINWLDKWSRRNQTWNQKTFCMMLWQSSPQKEKLHLALRWRSIYLWKRLRDTDARISRRPGVAALLLCPSSQKNALSALCETPLCYVNETKPHKQLVHVAPVIWTKEQRWLKTHQSSQSHFRLLYLILEFFPLPPLLDVFLCTPQWGTGKRWCFTNPPRWLHGAQQWTGHKQCLEILTGPDNSLCCEAHTDCTTAQETSRKMNSPDWHSLSPETRGALFHTAPHSPSCSTLHGRTRNAGRKSVFLAKSILQHAAFSSSDSVHLRIWRNTALTALISMEKDTELCREHCGSGRHRTHAMWPFCPNFHTNL